MLDLNPDIISERSTLGFNQEFLVTSVVSRGYISPDIIIKKVAFHLNLQECFRIKHFLINAEYKSRIG